MRASSTAERAGAGAARRAGLLLATLALLASPMARGGPPGTEKFAVERVSARLVDGVYLLDADLDLRFEDSSLEAMANGVPLTVALDIEVLRVRRHLWDPRIARLSARYTIRAHPLTGRYLVTDLASGASRSFPDIAQARAALGRIRGFPLIDAKLLEPGARYRLRVRARLDIEALPSPLRPLAYLESLWRLRGGWSEWSFEP